MEQQRAVYILVEPNQFKIGHSISVTNRAKIVTPNILWDQSSAIFFENIKDAIKCEKTLHWLFRSKRLPALNRDGGTEFFFLDCLPLLTKFIEDNQHTLGFNSIKRGGDLKPTVIANSKKYIPLKGEALRERKRFLREQEQKEADANKAASSSSVFATLKDFREKGILKGRILFHTDNEDSSKAIVGLLLAANQEFEHKLISAGFSPTRWSWCRLFSSAHGITRDGHLEIIDFESCPGRWLDHKPFLGIRECFAASFQLIEELPFFSAPITEAITSVWNDRLPVSSVIEMLNGKGGSSITDNRTYVPAQIAGFSSMMKKINSNGIM